MKLSIKSFGLLFVLVLVFSIFSIGKVSAAPVISKPQTNTKYNILPILYTFNPSADPALSKTLTFTPTSYVGSNKVMNLTSTAPSSQVNYVPSTNPALLSIVTSANFSSLPDGTYTVKLDYTGLDTNPYSSTVTGVTIDTVTQIPTFTSPAASSNVGNIMTVSYSLPENALSGSSALTFFNTTTSATFTLGLIDSIANSDSFTIDLNNISTNSHIATIIGTTNSYIPSGNYTVIYSYRDAVGNPVANVAHTNVVLDATVPTTTVPTTTVIPVQTTTPVVAALTDTGSNIHFQITIGFVLLAILGLLKLLNIKKK